SRASCNHPIIAHRCADQGPACRFLNDSLLKGGSRSVHAAASNGPAKAVITLTFPMSWATPLAITEENVTAVVAGTSRSSISIDNCALQYFILHCTKSYAIF